MGGFNEAWRLWIIAESLSQLTNGNFEHGFAYERPRPNGVEQFLFCDQPARMPKQIVQHREGFRSELYGLGAFPQALIAQVQAKGIEVDALLVPHRAHRNYRSFTAGL